MRHHQHLIAMRSRGYKPVNVWLDVDATPGVVDACAELNRMAGSHHVAIEEGEAVERLDFRFLIGCTVYVHGASDRTIDRTVKAVSEFAPSRVYGMKESTLLIADSEGIRELVYG